MAGLPELHVMPLEAFAGLRTAFSVSFAPTYDIRLDGLILIPVGAIRSFFLHENAQRIIVARTVIFRTFIMEAI
jgi:hypothetical protein